MIGKQFHVKGTKRNFVQTTYIEWEFEEKEENVLILENYKAAWSIDVAPLVALSKDYNVDFKIYAFEKGMQFNQDMEVVKGKVVKNDTIKWDDYRWECIDPSLGG
jgi:hypothetical protein